jgi:hypothetical protein
MSSIVNADSTLATYNALPRISVLRAFSPCQKKKAPTNTATRIRAMDIRKEILQPIPPHHRLMVWRMGSAAMEILSFISAIRQ